MSSGKRSAGGRFADLAAVVNPSVSDSDANSMAKTGDASDVPTVDNSDIQHGELSEVSPSGISLKRNSRTAKGGSGERPAVPPFELPEDLPTTHSSDHSSDSVSSTSSSTSDRRPVGRPAGKKSDPGYFQLGVYIPIDLHDDVKIAVATLNPRRRRKGLAPLEISSVVEELLTGWLEARKVEMSSGQNGE